MNVKMNEMENCFETILQFKNKELLAPESHELSVLNEFNNISKRTLHYEKVLTILKKNAPFWNLFRS